MYSVDTIVENYPKQSVITDIMWALKLTDKVEIEIDGQWYMVTKLRKGYTLEDAHQNKQELRYASQLRKAIAKLGKEIITL